MVLQQTVSQKEIADLTTRGLLDLQRGRATLGIAALKSAYEKSLQDESGKLRNSCGFNLGASLVAAGEAARGLPVLRRIPAENFGPRGALHLNLALGLEQLGKEEEALQEFQFAFEAMDAKDSELNTRAEIAVKLARAREIRSNWAEASKWFLSASELYHRLHQPLPRVRCLMRHAEGALKTGDEAKAMAALEDARAVLRHVTAGPARGQLFCELGVILLHLNKPQESVETLRDALPDLPRGTVEATAHQNLGAALNVQRKFEEAIPEHRAAVKLFGESGSRAAQGHCFVNMATAQNEIGRKDEARETFTHALQAAEDAHDVRTQWQCLEALGVLAFNAGEFARAVERFEAAMQLTGTPEERQMLVRRLERAVEQRQNVARLRSNPNLKEEAEKQGRGSESESEDDEELSPEELQAMGRIVRSTSGHKGKKWERFMERKATRERMFPNPKKNRVLLVNDAVLVPVDGDVVDAQSLTSVSTEDSTPDSPESSDSSEEGEGADDEDEDEDEDEDDDDEEEEDAAAVRRNYKEALKVPEIEKTRDRLEELAKRFGEEKEDRKKQSSDRGESNPYEEVARSSENPPPVPHFPGTAKLEGRGGDTYETPRRTRGEDVVNFFGTSGTGTYEVLGTGESTSRFNEDGRRVVTRTQSSELAKALLAAGLSRDIDTFSFSNCSELCFTENSLPLCHHSAVNPQAFKNHHMSQALSCLLSALFQKTNTSKFTCNAGFNKTYP